MLRIHLRFRMSTEQTESVPQVETQTAPADDITQQATTPTAKRVAARKMVAERTRLAREQQKKAAEAHHAENEAKAATSAPEPAPTTEEGESLKRSGGEKNSGLSTTQWLAVSSIVVSLIGIYYKREELKAMAKPVFDKIKTPEPAPEPAHVEPARATQRKGLKKMI